MHYPPWHAHILLYIWRYSRVPNLCAIPSAHVELLKFDEVLSDYFVDTIFDQESGDIGCHLNASTDFTKLSSGLENCDFDSIVSNRD